MGQTGRNIAKQDQMGQNRVCQISKKSQKGPVSGFAGCQCWTAEFKGITQPVLFMIFFYDFVTPQKRSTSEECWVFTLKVAVQ